MAKLTSFDIKLVAFGAMVVDHVGFAFFPEALWLRAIGRLSFPLFAWLVATGQQHTRSLTRYLIRLMVLAVLSQPVYVAFHALGTYDSISLNIVFTLALGVIAVSTLSRVKPVIAKVPLFLLFLLLAELLNLEGGAYAVTTIFFMSKFRADSEVWFLLFFLTSIVYVFVLSYPAFQLVAALSPLILLLYSGERGQRARWFYLFYPAHFAVLMALSWILS